MVVKDNQPTLWATIDRRFTEPPPPLPTDCLALAQTTEQGHGRLDTRTLERSAALTGSGDGPEAGQARRRTCRRVILATGEL